MDEDLKISELVDIDNLSPDSLFPVVDALDGITKKVNYGKIVSSSLTKTNDAYSTGWPTGTTTITADRSTMYRVSQSDDATPRILHIEVDTTVSDGSLFGVQDATPTGNINQPCQVIGIANINGGTYTLSSSESVVFAKLSGAWYLISRTNVNGNYLPLQGGQSNMMQGSIYLGNNLLRATGFTSGHGGRIDLGNGRFEDDSNDNHGRISLDFINRALYGSDTQQVASWWNGNIELANAPTADMHAATKKYVNDSIASAAYLPLAGGTMAGQINMAGNKIIFGSYFGGDYYFQNNHIGAGDYNSIDVYERRLESAIGTPVATWSDGHLKANYTPSDATDLITKAYADSRYILSGTTLTLTGDVTGSGTTSIATTIGAGKVLNSMIANGTIDLTTKVTGLLPDANIASAASWNAKEPAIAATTTNKYWRGDKTFQILDTSVVPENGSLYYTATRLRAETLAGLSIAGSAITSASTVLQAFGALQNQINGLLGGAHYQGTWNASTNTPSLADGASTGGFYWVTSVAGTVNFGSGNITFRVGDWAIYNGNTGKFELVKNSDAVSDVNGSIGSVSLTGTTNRITVTGTVWNIAATYVGQTSITTVGTIGTGIWQGTAIADTYISSAATWNAKQTALNGTGLVRMTGTTVSYDNNTYLTITAAAAAYLALDGSNSPAASINWNAQTITNHAGLYSRTLSSTSSYLTHNFLQIANATLQMGISKSSIAIIDLSGGATTIYSNGGIVYQNTTAGVPWNNNFQFPVDKGATTEIFAFRSDLTGFGAGSVTSVGAGTGMSFTTITGTGTVSINTTKVPYFSAGITGTPSSTTYLRGDGAWTTISAGATVAGATTQIQFNNAGAFGASSNFVYDFTNMRIGLGGAPSNALHLQLGTYGSNDAIFITGAINDFFETNIQNTSTGTSAQTSITVTADNGTLTSGFATVGINGSTFTAVNAYSIGIANDVNFMGSGNDMYIANASNTKDIIFSTGKASTPFFQEIARFTNKGNISFTQQIQTTGSPNAFKVTAAAHTTLTATTEAIDVLFNLSRTVQFATGAITTQRAFVVQAPAYSFVAASTITSGATFAISGPPVAGTNATITNPYSFWVQSGKSAFDGDLQTNQSTLSVFNTIATTITAFGAATSLTIGASASGTTTIRNTTVALTGGTLTGAATQNVFNSGSTTINAFAGGVTTVIGGSSTTSLSLEMSTNTAIISIGGSATVSGQTKTVNLGWGGVAGSTVNVRLGNPNVGQSSNIYLNGYTFATQQTFTSGNPGSTFEVQQKNHTNLTAGTEQILFKTTQSTVQWATGAIGTQRANAFFAPTIAFVGASTVTTAATLAITNAPQQGSNATITNALALWIQAGASAFNGGVTVGASTIPAASSIFQVISSSLGSIPIPVMAGSAFAAITTPAQGLWAFNNTLCAPTYMPTASGNAVTVSTTLFTQSANKAIANTTTPTSLVGTGVGSCTIKANSNGVGSTYKLSMTGFITTAVSPPFIQVQVLVGSIVVIDTTLTAMFAVTGSQLFTIESVFTVRASGASGNVIGQGIFAYATSVATMMQQLFTTNTGVSGTIDFTADKLVDVIFTFNTANASNTITSTNFTLEKIN